MPTKKSGQNTGPVDRDDVFWFLGKIVDDQWYYRDQRSSIKKWCITIWFASVASVASGTVTTPLFGAMLIIYVPLGFFWILEGFYGGIVVIKGRQIRGIESRIWTGDFTFDAPEEIFLSLGDVRPSLPEKLRAFLYALFFAETVWLLYFLLAAISGAFLLYFFGAADFGQPEPPID